MNLGYLGCSHTYFAVKDLEKLHISNENLPLIFNHIKQEPSIHGLCILMTCNRVEYYVESDTFTSACMALKKILSHYQKLSMETLTTMLREKKGTDALNHLFKVSCGIKSMVFGENEILGQIKQAYATCTTYQTNSPLINKALQSAIATGKRCRNETTISQGAYSISSISIEALREKCLDYFGQSILIIGAGIMANRLIQKLTALGHPDITLCNRTDQKALQLATDRQLKHLPFDQLSQHAKNYAIIFTATSSKTFLLNETHFTDASTKTLLAIDLGVPRNINPTINTHTKIERLTITNLKNVADKNIHRRKKDIDKATSIIKEESEKVFQWLTYKLKNNA